MSLRKVARFTVVTALAGACMTGWAQSSSPDRPIAFISSFSAGGATEVVARMLVQKLAISFGQPNVVENRAGAAGLIAEGYVSRAKPGGLPILIGSNRSHLLAALLPEKKPLDAVIDFEPILMLERYPQALVEVGVADGNAVVGVDYFAPEVTPASIVARLRLETVRAKQKDAEVRRVLTNDLIDVAGNDNQPWN